MFEFCVLILHHIHQVMAKINLGTLKNNIKKIFDKRKDNKIYDWIQSIKHNQYYDMEKNFYKKEVCSVNIHKSCETDNLNSYKRFFKEVLDNECISEIKVTALTEGYNYPIIRLTAYRKLTQLEIEISEFNHVEKRYLELKKILNK